MLQGSPAPHPRKTTANVVQSGSTRIAVVGRTASSLLSIKTDVEAEHPGVKVLTFVADIIDRAAVFAALEGTKKAFGPVDVLVSNAGYFPNPAPLAESDVDGMSSSHFLRLFPGSLELGSKTCSQAGLYQVHR